VKEVAIGTGIHLENVLKCEADLNNFCKRGHGGVWQDEGKFPRNLIVCIVWHVLVCFISMYNIYFELNESIQFDNNFECNCDALVLCLFTSDVFKFVI
jgi:hypothetical protein